MKKIKKLVDHIDDEIEGAIAYAECYLDAKSEGNDTIAGKYKEMAEDELSHAMILHDIASAKITKLQQVYTPPTEMLERWQTAHSEYIEKANLVKQMIG